MTSGNWVRFALTRPMLAAPGEDMDYSTGSTHLLSAILTQATGVSTWRFAKTPSPGRSASRYRSGHAIRRGSTSAATRC